MTKINLLSVRLYNIVAINKASGKKMFLFENPMIHSTACVALSKFNHSHKSRIIQIEDVTHNKENIMTKFNILSVRSINNDPDNIRAAEFINTEAGNIGFNAWPSDDPNSARLYDSAERRLLEEIQSCSPYIRDFLTLELEMDVDFCEFMNGF